VASHRLLPALALLGLVVLGGAPQAHAMLPPFDDPAQLASDDARVELTQFAQAQPQPTPSPSPTMPAAQPSPAASATPAPADEPIGNVATLTGTATVIRNRDSIALKLKDDIFLNDTVQTSSGASLGITFNDDTTFHLSANAKITIDSYVYEPGGSKNAGIFDIGKGTVAFVAAQVAKTGNMQINTPAASLGIRGTSGLVEVPEGGAAASDAHNIKLYPDADGHVGRIEVSDRQGARLGTLTQGASGFAVRPGVAGARATAAPLTISPQQAVRDRGFVSQAHQTQNVGRQIVTEQRAIRRANPPQPGQPPRQPGAQPQQPQRQPGQPSPTPNGQKQTPGTPKATPQPGTPKATPTPGTPKGGEKKGGEKQTPGTPKGEKKTQDTPKGTPNGTPKGEKQTTAPNGQKETPGTAPTPSAPNRQGSREPGTPAQPVTPPQPNRQGLQQAPGAPQPGPSGPVRSDQGPQPGPRPGVQGQPLPQHAGQPRPGGLQGAPAFQRPKPPPVPQRGKQKKRPS
jgi:FecR protein